ncbi:MAG: mannitol dehydrogenase family protein, partial [Rhodospirillaceae bacterium]
MTQAAAQAPGAALLSATTYDRSDCAIGFVHLGCGAFHRAHQAVYIDDYMQATGDLRWGIAAVNLRASEADSFAQMQQATEGYLLKTTAPDGTQALRLVRAHCRFSDWVDDAQEAEALLALPTVHALTITVTESGYYLADDGSLNSADPVIAAELAGGPPSSVYGYLARALNRRLAAHGQPLNILCCDNIRANGRLLKANVLAYLHHLADPALLDWVQQAVSFPSSMVDRITPRATDALIAEVEGLFPAQTLAPIHGEQFSQWVLEDRFCAPMPDLGRAGVQVVTTVDPFEEAKIRILNGGHTALCYFGALAGHSTFDQAIKDPSLRAVFDAYQEQEVLLGLSDIALPFDAQAYLQQIAARFSNSAIADQLERICMDGYSKMQLYIRPTLEACLRQGVLPRIGLSCVASWVVYARRAAAGRVAIP